MPKRKFIPEATYRRMPYASERPLSLWWYKRLPAPVSEDDVPSPESRCVIDTYLRRASRGRTIPNDFEKKLLAWLQDLSREHSISPRKKAYWTIPAYARSKKLPAFTLMKRFRELENVAKELFPHRVPPSRQPFVLTEERREDMRKRFLAGEDIQVLAEKFGIKPFRVGQICKDLKAIRRAQRERDEAQQATTPESDNPEHTLDGGPSDTPF